MLRRNAWDGIPDTVKVPDRCIASRLHSTLLGMYYYMSNKDAVPDILRSDIFEQLSFVAQLCSEDVQDWCKKLCKVPSDVIMCLTLIGDDGKYDWISESLVLKTFYYLKSVPSSWDDTELDGEVPLTNIYADAEHVSATFYKWLFWAAPIRLQGIQRGLKRGFGSLSVTL
jgi:hypothetical protein